MNESMKTLAEAADRFYSNYRDSYGFILMAYLCARRLTHYSEDAVRQQNVLETLAADDPAGEPTGRHGWSIWFDDPGEDVRSAVEVLLADLRESREMNAVPAKVVFDVHDLLLRVNFDAVGDGLESFLLDCAAKVQSRKAGNKWHRPSYVLPNEMRRLIASVMNYDGGIVYAPTAGGCMVAREAGVPDDLLYAAENDERLWAADMCISRIVGYLPAEYRHRDYLNVWPLVRPSFVVATPEPNSILPTLYEDENGTAILTDPQISLEKHLIQRSFLNLSSDGRVVVTATADILGASHAWNDDDMFQLMRDDRHAELDRYERYDIYNYIPNLDTVILLPKGLVKSPETSQVILVFDNAKTYDIQVRMVDASRFVTPTSGLGILQVDELLEAIENEYPGVVCHVPLEVVMDEGHDLNPAMYVRESLRLEIPKGSRRLGEMIDRYDGERPNDGDNVVLKVSPKTIDGRIYPYEMIPGKPVRIITRDCLVLNRLGNMRPIFYEQRQEQNTGVGADSLAFLLHEDIDVDYLLTELNKDYVKQQVAALRKGSVRSILQVDDIMKIRLYVPDSIERQREVVAESAGTIAKEYSERYVREMEKEYKEKMASFEREMHLRKHALNQHLNAFIPGLSRLVSAMEKNGGVLKDDMIIGSASGETAKQRLEKLNRYAANIQELVQSLTDDGADYDAPEDIHVVSFVDDYCARRIHDCYRLELAFDRHQSDVIFFGDYEGKDPELYASRGEYIDDYTVSVSNQSLTKILDNVLANAEKYGFTDPERNDYAVRFSTAITESDGEVFLVLKISNNGNPLPKGMSPEKVFQWGETSNGTGLGGWQIASIANQYGGYAKMNCNESDKDGFVVEYEIGFKISNIEATL